MEPGNRRTGPVPGVEIIELADQGLLDIVRARKVEQEVLDLLDEPTTR